MRGIKSMIFQYLNFLLCSMAGKCIVCKKTRSIFDIDYKELHGQNIRLLIFDIDDTLCPSKSDLPKKTKKLLTHLIKKNDSPFFIGILSNCGNKRKKMIMERLKPLGILIKNSPHKPATRGYKKIMAHFDTSPNSTAVIGDRVGTDMWGAYKAGINKRILLEPFSNCFGGRKHIFVVRFARFIEKKFMPPRDLV